MDLSVVAMDTNGIPAAPSPPAFIPEFELPEEDDASPTLLPPDLWPFIVAYLNDSRDLLALSRMDASWHDFITSSERVWRDRAERRWKHASENVSASEDASRPEEAAGRTHW